MCLCVGGDDSRCVCVCGGMTQDVCVCVGGDDSRCAWGDNSRCACAGVLLSILVSPNTISCVMYDISSRGGRT